MVVLDNRNMEKITLKNKFSLLSTIKDPAEDLVREKKEAYSDNLEGVKFPVMNLNLVSSVQKGAEEAGFGTEMAVLCGFLKEKHPLENVLSADGTNDNSYYLNCFKSFKEWVHVTAEDRIKWCHQKAVNFEIMNNVLSYVMSIQQPFSFSGYKEKDLKFSTEKEEATFESVLEMLIKGLPEALTVYSGSKYFGYLAAFDHVDTSKTFLQSPACSSKYALCFVMEDESAGKGTSGTAHRCTLYPDSQTVERCLPITDEKTMKSIQAKYLSYMDEHISTIHPYMLDKLSSKEVLEEILNKATQNIHPIKGKILLNVDTSTRELVLSLSPSEFKFHAEQEQKLKSSITDIIDAKKKKVPTATLR